MTPEEIAVKMEGHEHEIKSLKHRMDTQEEESKSIQALVISVERIALSTEHIMKEQEKQGERQEQLSADVDELKAKPAKRWDGIVEKIILTVIGAIVIFMLTNAGIS
nr:hypothetical protein [uncultured Acetatifactor sp.]